MPSPFKFFAGLALGFLCVLALELAAFGLALGVPTESSRWTFEINRKKQELAAASAPPRLLIVAGSSGLFGLNAREIERQTGHRTLNLSTHAALGVHYMLEQTRKIARPGDTVLLAFEYELYTTGPTPARGADGVWIDYLVARDPKYFHQLSLTEQWNVFMLTSVPRLKIALKNRFNPARYPEHSSGGGIYNADFIDAWGDQTGHSRATAKQIDHSKIWPVPETFPEHPAAFPAIASFCQWAAGRGIKVLATYPNIMDDPVLHSARAQQAIARITGLFAQLGVPVVGDYASAVLPADQFFDSPYHLTDEAALARTQRLIGDLQPWLKKSP